MTERVNRAVYRPSWLVKPTHACNFSCKYCYDTDMRKKYGDGIMTMEVWEKIVSIASKYNAHIVFHGGEPLMAGIDWYKEAFAIADKYPSLTYGMQSNGSLLDDEYLELFKTNNVYLGISYDFSAQADYRGFDILTNIRLAKKHSVPVGCICVVTKKNIDNLIEIFEVMVSEQFGHHISFNPLFYSNSVAENSIDMLTMEDLRRGYGKFFKYYITRQDTAYYEREAETYLSLTKGLGSRECVFNDCRAGWVGVTSVGNVYPCDKYYGDEYMYGNILEFNSVSDFVLTKGFAKLYQDVDLRFRRHCSKCKYISICNGGCNGRHIAVGSLRSVDNDACNLVHTMYSLAKEVFSQ